MADAPLRVRLSAEGVEEVVQALRRISREAGVAGKEAKTGITGLSSVFSGISASIARVTVVTAAIGLALNQVVSGAQQAIATVRRLSDEAERIQDTSRDLGATIEDLSVLETVASRSGTGIERAQRAWLQYLSVVQSAAAGDDRATASLEAVGLAASRLASLDFKGQVIALADALAKLPDGPEKTAKAIDLLGKRGVAALPILRELSEGGFERARADAVKLGLILDAQVLERVAAIDDAFEDLSKSVRNRAFEFLAEAGPDLVVLLREITQAAAVAAPALGSLGRAAAFVLDMFTRLGILIVENVVGPIDSMVTAIRVAGVALSGFVGGAVADLSGLAEAANRVRAAAGREAARIGREFADRQASREARVRAQLSRQSAEGQSGAQDSESSALALRSITRTFAERRTLLEAEMRREEALARAGFALREEAASESYEQGLTTLREYFSERRRLIEKDAADVVARLNRRLELESQPGGSPERVRELKNEVETRRLKEQLDLLKLSNDEVQKRVALGRSVLELQLQQAKATGADTKALEEATARIKGAETRRLLGQAGRPEDQITAIVSDLFVAEQRQNAFNDALQAGRDILEDLDRERDAIRERVAAGQLGEISAARELQRIEKGRVDSLREVSRNLTDIANAPGGAVFLKQAKDFAAEVGKLSISIEAVGNALATLKTRIEESLGTALTSFFQDGIREAEDFADAITRIANDLFNQLSRQYATDVAKSITAGISSLLPRFASGGLVRGRGTGTSDSVPALLSNGEFVVNASAVKDADMLKLLQAVNSGALRRVDQLGLPDISGGGLVGVDGPDFVAAGSGGGPGADFSGTLRVELGEGLEGRVLGTPEGRQMVLDIIARNPRQIRKALGVD